MRVFILTDKAERHYYFINRLIRETGSVVGVITGAKYTRPKQLSLKDAKDRKNIAYSVRNGCLSAAFYPYGSALYAEKEREEAAAFGGSQALFLKDYHHLLTAEVTGEHGSVNDPFYVDMIRAAKPDVVVVMGTCMIGKAIINATPHVLNIHTGLSPYYRGGYTNLWPIIENQYGYFGVTVHKLSLGIDSGDIIYSARPEVFADDNFPRINCRCIQIGTGFMVEALRRVEEGNLKAIKQWTAGRLYFDRDMNRYVAFQYFRKRNAYFKEYCRRAEAGELDTVKQVVNGECQ